MKQRYYSSKKIRELDCDYNIILGERSNGKSYDVKNTVCLEDAINDKTGMSKFIYLRRWDLDLKPSLVVQYFADAQVKLMTKGEYDCVNVYNGKVYLAKLNDKNKPENGTVVGYVRALTMAEHYKSGIYEDVKNIIYEEFVTKNQYLAKEPQQLQQFVSTIARRRKVKVWLIGNTISRLCPYFTEWELRNIPRQKQGTIEIYEHKTDQYDEDGNPVTIRIAVEYAENSGKNSQMFFGSSAKMITSGAWQSEEKPHLPKKLSGENYMPMHEMVVEWAGFRFFCQFLIDMQSGAALWYVEPKTTAIQPNTRTITDRVTIDMYTTRGFIPLAKNEQIAFSYLKQGIIYYSDNLTGADFEACMKQLLTNN